MADLTPSRHYHADVPEGTIVAYLWRDPAYLTAAARAALAERDARREQYRPPVRGAGAPRAHPSEVRGKRLLFARARERGLSVRAAALEAGIGRTTGQRWARQQRQEAGS